MMNKSIKQILCFAAAGCLGVSASFAAVPTYTTFDQLSDLTAGGTPNKNVAITTYGGLTLGLAAQQRYLNDPVTDNSAGVYYANPGHNAGDSAHPIPTGSYPYKFMGSTWNFDFYIKNTSTESFTYSISYGLTGGTVYTFDPTADGDADDKGDGTLQDSQNLMFSNFGGAPNAFSSTYDPDADGTYDFLLTAKDNSGAVVAQSGIQVVVGNGSSVPDSGSTMALLGVACAGIGLLKRKFLV